MPNLAKYCELKVRCRIFAMITSELANGIDYQIGNGYRLKLSDSYYRVTLVSVDYNQTPPMAHVIIKEHSVDSFNGNSNIRRRHTKWSEAVPCADVPLHDLQL